MADVFLSYKREDQTRIAPLVWLLERKGLSVWWDTRLAPGERFTQVIQHEIERSRCVVVAWSANSINAGWVQDEAAAGRDRGILVPLSLDGVPPPFGFRGLQTPDLTGWTGDDDDPRTRRLIEAVVRIVRHPANAAHEISTQPEPARPPEPKGPRGLSRRRLLQAGAALGAAGLVSVGSLVISKRIPNREPLPQVHTEKFALRTVNERGEDNPPQPESVEVFAVLEDLRVDAAAPRLFAGLAPAYARVRHAALADRPELALLPPRAAVAEALVRFSLGARQVLAPAVLHGPLSTVVAVAARLLDPAATVEPSAEAAIRVYAVLAGLPNVGAIRTARPVAFDSLAADPELGPDDPRLVAAAEEVRLEGDEALDVRLVPVRYRDVPGPRYAGQAASGMPLQEAILRMTVETEQSQDADTDGFTERSLQAERGGVDVTATERPPEPLPHDHGPDLDDHH